MGHYASTENECTPKRVELTRVMNWRLDISEHYDDGSSSQLLYLPSIYIDEEEEEPESSGQPQDRGRERQRSKAKSPRKSFGQLEAAPTIVLQYLQVTSQTCAQNVFQVFTEEGERYERMYRFSLFEHTDQPEAAPTSGLQETDVVDEYEKQTVRSFAQASITHKSKHGSLVEDSGQPKASPTIDEVGLYDGAGIPKQGESRQHTKSVRHERNGGDCDFGQLEVIEGVEPTEGRGRATGDDGQAEQLGSKRPINDGAINFNAVAYGGAGTPFYEPKMTAAFYHDYLKIVARDLCSRSRNHNQRGIDALFGLFSKVEAQFAGLSSNDTKHAENEHVKNYATERARGKVARKCPRFRSGVSSIPEESPKSPDQLEIKETFKKVKWNEDEYHKEAKQPLGPRIGDEKKDRHGQHEQETADVNGWYACLENGSQRSRSEEQLGIPELYARFDSSIEAQRARSQKYSPKIPSTLRRSVFAYNEESPRSPEESPDDTEHAETEHAETEHVENIATEQAKGKIARKCPRFRSGVSSMPDEHLEDSITSVKTPKSPEESLTEHAHRKTTPQSPRFRLSVSSIPEE